MVYLILLIALFADILASDKPLYCKFEGRTYFPVFHEYLVKTGVANSQQIAWKKIKPETALWPPVRYSPQEIDLNNAQFASPNDVQNIPSHKYKHYLGTDALGKDVMSGMIHGTRIALAVGILSMLIASFIGILAGGLSGFYGDDGIKISRASLYTGIVFLFIAFFYGFQCRAFQIEDAMDESFGAMSIQLLISITLFFVILIFGYFIAKPLKKLKFLSKKVILPVDIIISRFIEVFTSIPKLFLIFSLIIMIKPSLYLIIVVIGLLSWTEIARFIRAEMLRIRKMEYIESATALGLPKWRIVLRHALPNALPPVLITISFGIAAAILTESSLSFLGIGLPIDTLSWGKLLSSAREAPQAWWLAVFPGLAIFITVTAFNLIGEGLSDAMDARADDGNA